MRVLWAHGLEGSPNGSKPTWISDNLGWEVLCPAMSDYGWTIAEQTEVIAKNIAENEDIDVVMGSSYGGLAIANASERFAGRELRLVLLAPAFGLAENFRSIAGEQGLNEWEKTGLRQYFHHGFGHEVPFGWDFITSADEMSWPTLHHPTVILHGNQDDIVPLESSRKVAESNELVELIEVEDGHRLAGSLHFIPLAVQRVLSR
ncbi:MAG: alpha/beta hydrolase family protein [Candidatus Thalassarchaeaceae archaeon]|nr:MAG: hypothetical protein CND66_00390 [Marine Group II euryarchaeote MED-G37]|tara:strand:+ start:141 stop:752 length:612 start_codon:yes stop_codon:yes gene_type:complete